MERRWLEGAEKTINRERSKPKDDGGILDVLSPI